MVYVDLVGRTDRRWISHQDGIPANLANTGLNVHTVRRVLTSEHYGTARIDVANRLGSFGWLFVDRHGSEWIPAHVNAAGHLVPGQWGTLGDLIAFRAESTYVTGFVNAEGTRFNVPGGTSFIIANPTINLTGDLAPVVFWNGFVRPGLTDNTSAAGMIRNIAGSPMPAHATDAREVTLAVTISGTTITRIHSILGWRADEARVAIASDLTRIEGNNSLLRGTFPLDLNQRIDYSQFQLIGVDCLLEIEPENVVFIYTEHGSDVIRRVAVGTEVVEGEMNEASSSRLIVDGRVMTYSFDRLTSLTRNSATAPDDVWPYAGSDVRVLLDAYGRAFRIDILDQEVGNFGMVLLSTDSNDPRGYGLRLYTNEDEERFFNLNIRNYTMFSARPFTGDRTTDRRSVANWEDPVGFVPGPAPAGGGNPNVVIPAGPTSRMIGFGLTGAGIINVIEHAVDAGMIDIRSTSVIRVTSAAQPARDLALDPNVAIFYWNTASEQWEVAGISDLDLSWFRTPANANMGGQYILNTAGNRVIALVINENAVDGEGDNIFGLLTNWGNVGNGAANLTGFFDGAVTTSILRTANDSNPNIPVNRANPQFFMFGTNAAGVINSGVNLITTNPQPRFVSGSEQNPDWATPLRVTRSAVFDAVQLLDHTAPTGWIDFGRNALMVEDNLWITYYDDVVVYRATRSAGNTIYAASSLGAINPEAWVWAFNTAASPGDVTGAAHVVIWMDNDDFPAEWLTGIVTQPTSTIVNDGANAIFTVTASSLVPILPTPITFDWQRWDGTDWQPVVGFDTTALNGRVNTLELPGVTYAADNGARFRVLVNGAPSAAVTLTVRQP